jgi:hypothetical protein
MFQRPSNKRFSGTSKYGLEIEIGISKSNCLLDGLYRNTFPLIKPITESPPIKKAKKTKAKMKEMLKKKDHKRIRILIYSENDGTYIFRKTEFFKYSRKKNYKNH